MLNKGIVSFKIINNVKIFRPVNPESLYSLFKEKERELEQQKKDLKQFISKLKKIEIKDKKENDFKYFEGINGVRSMFTEFIENFTPDSSLHIASAPIAYEKWNAFLLDLFHPPRIKKNINLQLIVPAKLKKHAQERKKLKPIEIKFSDVEMSSYTNPQGEPEFMYRLNFLATMVLVTGYGHTKIGKVIDRMRGEDESVSNIARAMEVAKYCAEMCGLEGNQALLAANHAMETCMGKSPTELLGLSFEMETGSWGCAASNHSGVMSSQRF